MAEKQISADEVQALAEALKSNAAKVETVAKQQNIPALANRTARAQQDAFLLEQAWKKMEAAD